MSDGNYKYEIGSIMNEQVDFYSNFFNQKGGMKIVHTNLQGVLHKLFHGRVNKLLTYFCLNDFVPSYNKC